MKRSHRLLAFLLVSLFAVTLCSTCFAAGVETFPYQGWYEVGSFTFSGYNITPLKTVPGRYLTIYTEFHKSIYDAGTGAVELTIAIRDYDTGTLITGWPSYGISNGGTVSNSYTYDLGYSGRRVQIWFVASSAAGGSGTSRTVSIDIFRVYNTD